jgi:predicted TIM-barrel fold metal-dependent hydrolase
MTQLTAPTPSVPSSASLPTGIIDSDVHPHFNDGYHRGGMDALAPYMTESWRQRLAIGGRRGVPTSFPRNSLYLNVGGGMRVDAMPDGQTPASDPVFVGEHLLDAHAIDRAILIGGQLFGIGAFPDPTVAATVASAYNEWMLEHWLQVDKRYRGALVVAPQDPDAAVREIERMADRPGIVSIFMPLNDILWGERHYYPIYEAAQRHALPVMTHPSGTEAIFARGAPHMGGTPTYYIEYHQGLSQIHQSNLVSLVCHGVFERFPELKVVIVEGGFAWAAETMWKLDRDWHSLRDEVPWLKRYPSEYVRDHVRFTTQPMVEPHRKEHLNTLLEMVYAEETLIFSSDYPHWDFDDPHRALSGISASLRQRICVDNPRALYGDRL